MLLAAAIFALAIAWASRLLYWTSNITRVTVLSTSATSPRACVMLPWPSIAVALASISLAFAVRFRTCSTHPVSTTPAFTRLFACASTWLIFSSNRLIRALTPASTTRSTSMGPTNCSPVLLTIVPATVPMLSTVVSAVAILSSARDSLPSTSGSTSSRPSWYF